MVQRLADAYGGWDETTIAQELPQLWSNNPADLSFCLLLLLYRRVSDLEPENDGGLGTSWRVFDGVLQRAGWDNSERELFIRGHNFGVFWDRYLSDNTQSSEAAKTRDVFEGIRPAAIAASAGWLERSEAIALKQRLDADKSRIRSALRNADDLEALRRAEELLQMPASHDKGLCLIVSG
ncbi:MAG: hypothetical protein KY475_08175 [Planctomycetes bacterium]|nr:hypothetical protein [Planctomycetota bacterium]